MPRSKTRRPRAEAGTVPLNRALSKLGMLSRARAAEAILAGRVRVDGRVENRPAVPVVPERVRITIDGTEMRRAAWRTILLYKPRGVVTTRSDPEGRATVYDVAGNSARGLVPVGRLDLATTGLLLLTSDTRLANWITDPAHAVPRVYLATVRGRVSEEMVARLDQPAVRILKASNRETHLIVELREGRNRQVFRMFEGIGHEVTRLKRVKLGGLELGDLEPGEFREVGPEELKLAFPGAPISRGPV